jgi:hypothetical protein
VETVDVAYVELDYVDPGYVDVSWRIAIDGELYSLDEFGRELVEFWHRYLGAMGLLPANYTAHS